MALAKREIASRKQLICDLRLEELDDIWGLEKRAHLNPWSRELIQNEFQNETSLKFGLYLDAQLVAYIFAHLVEQEVHILNIAVEPEFQNQGLAKVLLENLLEKTLALGCTRALLEVRPSNAAALRVYRRFDFKVLAARKNYYRDNQEDALILEKIL